MKKGYWIGHLEVKNSELHQFYIPKSSEAVQKFGGVFLVRGGACDAVEGHTRPRHIVIEFPSYQAARDCYYSDDYCAARLLRSESAVADIVVVEGI
jgi:uncharacterized protein (DUF1330 family)